MLTKVFDTGRMKIVRTQLDDGSRVVGLLVPPGMMANLQRVFQENSADALAAASTAPPEKTEESPSPATMAAAAAAAATPRDAGSAGKPKVKPAPSLESEAWKGAKNATDKTSAASAAAAAAASPSGLSGLSLSSERLAVGTAGTPAVAQGISESTLLGSGQWEPVALADALVRFAIVNVEPDDAALIDMRGDGNDDDDDDDDERGDFDDFLLDDADDKLAPLGVGIFVCCF